MSGSQRILLIEDDRRLSGLIRDYLQPYGFEVLVEDRGDQAVQRIERENPDLVVLDLMLPGKDGLTVCQQSRLVYKGPILILTAQEDDMDQVAGLEMGADDYVKKPILPRVLLARIRALFRRFDRESAAESSTEELWFGSLRISRQDHQVFLDEEPVDLTTNEFELLWLLAVHSGQVLNRERLLTGMRGIAYDGLDRTVDMTISRLRRKLGDDAGQPRKIKTVWGQGYLFVKNAW